MKDSTTDQHSVLKNWG